MLFLLLSIFGLIISDRIVYRHEIYKIIFPKNRTKIFIVINLPSLYFIIFKEHLVLFFIYIGGILLSLILFNIYFDFFLKKVFFRGQIRVLEAINLHIRSGQSPIKSAKSTFQTLTTTEKIVFEPLNYIEVDLTGVHKVPIYARNKFFTDYFSELISILRSSNRVADQIDQFRKGLKIQNNLRHKSRLSAVQVRAQALVAAIIYLFLLFFSISELQLSRYPEVIVLSVALMGLGLYLILKTGNRVKWTI